MNRLLVDLSVISRHDAGTGIQRVVRAVYHELSRAAGDELEVVAVAADFTCGYRHLDEAPPANGADSSRVAAREVTPAEGDVFLGLDLASAIMPRHQTQLAEWRAAGMRIAIVLYDMLPLRHPGWFRRRARWHFRRWLATIERHADLVVCNSQAVRQDFERWNGRFWRRGKAGRIPVAVVPLAGDIGTSQPSRGLPSDAADILEWIGRRPTVLMVGTIEPRKGHDQALAAFRRLWRNDGDSAPQLLIVGRPGWKTARLQRRLREQSGISGRLLWLDHVSDEFLGQIYAQVTGLLFASRGEGFGLPMVEAEATGLPLLARDLPVLREVGGPGATYFSGNSARCLADAISAWLLGPSAVPQEPGPIARRTWRDVAAAMLHTLGLEADESAEVPAPKTGMPTNRSALHFTAPSIFDSRTEAEQRSSLTR